MGDQGAIFQRPTRQRGTNATIVLVEDFRTPVLGFWNDGALGTNAFRTNLVTFAGMPTLCIDASGIAATLGADPGAAGPNTGGVVCKRRIGNRYSTTGPLGGKWGLEYWLYLSGTNLTTNSQVTQSVYIRDGTNIYIGRVWFEAASIGAAPVSIRFQQSNGTWVEKGTYNWQRAVTFSPNADSFDQGEWHYCKLRIDLGNLKYIDFQFNDLVIDLSADSLRTAADASGGRSLHFSFELLNGSTAQDRLYHVGGPIVVTQE